MTTLAQTLAVPRRWSRPRARTSVLLVLAGSLLVAGLAQVVIHLPFTPVPVTGQTLGVLLVGAALGPGLGAASLLLYLAEGAVGLPFFAGASHGVSLLGAASIYGGYLWGFVVAAAVVGVLARAGWDRSPGSAIGAMVIGEIALFLVAVPWFAHAAHLPAARAVALGAEPFVVGEILKVLIAAGVLPAAWRLTGRA